MYNLHVGTALCCTAGPAPFMPFIFGLASHAVGREGEGGGGESPEWQAEKPIEAQAWARICKRPMGPGIDSEESSPPAYTVTKGSRVSRL